MPNKQYCPPRSSHGKGKGGNGKGQGKACGNQQHSSITQRAHGTNAHNQGTSVQRNAGRNARGSAEGLWDRTATRCSIRCPYALRGGVNVSSRTRKPCDPQGFSS
jgi:hypothetical protein